MRAPLPSGRRKARLAREPTVNHNVGGIERRRPDAGRTAETGDVMRLGRETLDRLPPHVSRPAFRARATGVVHLGAGAFHRAHQAAYIDTVLRDDPRWKIAAVSMRSAGAVEPLRAQGELYTLAIRGSEPAWRVIGAHTAFLGPDERDRGLALLARDSVRLVTITVTEKGYALGADGTLDLAHADISHDLAHRDAPASAIGWLVHGLAARRSAGLAPFMAMPCDNLADNGAKLKAAMVAFARAAGDAVLADWIAGELRAPGTMVDSITPATDATLVADAAAVLGLRDEAPVQREPFAQWVIEDVGGSAPDLASAGAIVTADVAAYERAKLRILNGAHSTLAYLGLLRGRATVADAMADAELAAFVSAMIAEEIAPALPPAAGLDLAAYAADVLARFRNRGIVHRLAQIAIDGSQKLPYRLGDTLAARLATGAPPGRVAAALGGWIAWLMARAGRGRRSSTPRHRRCSPPRATRTRRRSRIDWRRRGRCPPPIRARSPRSVPPPIGSRAVRGERSSPLARDTGFPYADIDNEDVRGWAWEPAARRTRPRARS